MLEEDKEVFNSYTDYFVKYLLPLALQYGMTPSDFWREDPELLDSYHIFYKNKRNEIDAEEWKMGLYVYTGVQTALANAFRKSGTPPAKYPKENFLATHENQQVKQKQLEMNIKKMMEQSIKAFNDKKGK